MPSPEILKDLLRIWCCACSADVNARLTSGAEVYPHRPDLSDVPRWICDTCGNHVGTHHKTADRTRPLGNIPSPELKKARIAIHNLIDPAWRSNRISRRAIYAHLSKAIGREYHTGEIRTIVEAREIYRTAQALLSQHSIKE